VLHAKKKIDMRLDEKFDFDTMDMLTKFKLLTAIIRNVRF
jgi:hypothetical protein